MRLLNVFVALFAVAVVATVVLVGVGRYENKELGIKNQESVPAIPPALHSFSDGGNNAVGPQNDGDAKNLTKDLTAEVAKDIVARNPDGPVSIENKEWINVVEPDKIVNLIVADSLKNFNAKDFYPEIKLADLKINNGAKADVYLKTFKDILQYNFGNHKIDITNPNPAALTKLIESYNQAIKSFYNLEVPETLVDIHKKEIAYLTGQKRFFEAFANYKEDPVRALLAAQIFEQLNDKFADLNLAIAEFIKKNNVQI